MRKLEGRRKRPEKLRQGTGALFLISRQGDGYTEDTSEALEERRRLRCQDPEASGGDESSEAAGRGGLRLCQCAAVAVQILASSNACEDESEASALLSEPPTDAADHHLREDAPAQRATPGLGQHHSVDN